MYRISNHSFNNYFLPLKKKNFTPKQKKNLEIYPLQNIIMSRIPNDVEELTNKLQPNVQWDKRAEVFKEIQVFL